MTTGVNDDSAFRLDAPENAVGNHKVPIILQHGSPIVSVDIEGITRSMILDTGFEYFHHAHRHIERYGTGYHDGNVLSNWVRSRYQRAAITFWLDRWNFTHTVGCALPTKAASVLGTDFF